MKEYAAVLVDVFVRRLFPAVFDARRVQLPALRLVRVL